MFEFIVIIWLYHLLYYITNYPFPQLHLTIVTLWPLYYLLCFVVLALPRKLQYLMCITPMIISAVIKTTIAEGVFASCIACVFSMKMYAYVESGVTISLSQYNHYLWTPTLIFEPKILSQKRSRSIQNIIKCIINSFLIILWDVYFINYEINTNFQLDDFPIFLSRYAFRMGILIVVNHYLIFDYLIGLFCEISSTSVVPYEDWWNADGFSQLNRKWNRQVHLFLKIHFYQKYCKKFNHVQALIITYFVTGLLHEYCLGVALKTFRPYFIIFSCFQFLLIPYQKYVPFPRFILFSQIIFGSCFLMYLTAKY